ncbi:MAG: non-canonical purine NTP pyrophosphatase [Thermoanaerobaculia bacterium]
MERIPRTAGALDARRRGRGGIARTAIALGDPRARAVAILAWTDGEKTILAHGAVSGTMPRAAALRFGFDPVFLPDGSERTFGELEGADKDRFSHRGKAWRELLLRMDRRDVSGNGTIA